MLAALESCVLCGASKDEWKRVFRLNKDQDLVKCARCALVFNNVRETDLGSVYSDEYFTADEKKAAGGYFNYGTLEGALNKNYRFAYNFIRRQSKGQGRSYSILDIGCGYGYFLKQFKKDGRFKLTGIEMNSLACSESKRYSLDVRNAKFEDYPAGEKFDFALLFEFIEHSLDPNHVMEKLYAVVKDEGYALLTTPNIGSFFFPILKKKWPAIHPVSHNFYFSPQTISSLAAKNGFRVVFIKTRQIYRINILQLRKRMHELFPAAGELLNCLSFLDNKIIPFLSGGTMEVILKKV